MSVLVYNSSKGQQSFFYVCWFITTVKGQQGTSNFAGHSVRYKSF